MRSHRLSVIVAGLLMVLPTTTRALAQEEAAKGGEERSDAIANAIGDEFAMDRAIPEGDIQVELTAGVATLSGKVDNLRASERAARIAETVKGVAAVVNLIEVEPAVPRSDTQVKQDVEAALLADPATDSYEVSTKVEDGTVTLAGQVDSWKERELCAKVANGVKGVKELVNEIRVSPKAVRPALEIENEIDAALRWDVLVDDALVDAKVVEDGMVRLTGTVGSAAEKSRVESAAWVAGVTSVDASGLEVARWARDPDLRGDKYTMKSAKEIERAVETALAVDPRVYSFHVTPVATSGIVTLRGTVDNLKAKRAAEQIARHSVGVLSVRNHIDVRPEEERSDEQIEADLRAALLRDPDVSRFEITVDVEGGTAYLYGTVDSFYEQARADDVASRVQGVTNVHNALAVEAGPYGWDPYVDDWYIYGYPWYGYRPPVVVPSDAEIREDIRDELFWSPFVDSDEVRVSVENGVATLTGVVDSWMELGAARDNAYEGGASYVRNELEVRGAASGSGDDSTSVQ